MNPPGHRLAATLATTRNRLDIHSQLPLPPPCRNAPFRFRSGPAIPIGR